MVYPPDKTCAIVVIWVEFPEVSDRTTDSVAENAAAGAKIEHFGPAGTGTISGIKGKAYSGSLQADNGTWAIKSTYVQLRPTVWAIEAVKWRQTATTAQQAACTAASEGVTLNHHWKTVQPQSDTPDVDPSWLHGVLSLLTLAFRHHVVD
jgi:hypothetical protein